jgi:hypothetical protein
MIAALAPAACLVRVYYHESAVTVTDAPHGDHRLAVRGEASLGGWCKSMPSTATSQTSMMVGL